MAVPMARGVVAAPRSTGLARAAAPGAPIPAWSAGASSGTARPAASAASAARTFTPPALPTIANRSPAGNGWSTSSRAVSSSSPSVSQRMTPACVNSVSTVTSGAAAAAVCEAPAREPLTVRPLLTASTGLRRASARATRANRRGLPTDSRYSATARVPGSSYQYDSRSLPLTSALLPSETKLDSPAPVREAWSRMVMATAPDWEATASPPGAGVASAKVACSRTAGSVLSTPRQFGPTSRMPLARAMRTSSAWALRPAGPSSPKPDESTTAARTPIAPHSASTPATAGAGTAMTARSTEPGSAATDG
jgi:hypothetical protein